MLFQGIVIGYACQEGSDKRPAVSPNFPEVIKELEYQSRRYSNFEYQGCVNIGEPDCQRLHIAAPVRCNISYSSHYEGLNQLYRKRFPKVTNDYRQTPVRPTIVLMQDKVGELVGVISVPPGRWDGVRYRFLENLKFFLDPTPADYHRGMRPSSSNHDIIIVDTDSWYEEEKIKRGDCGMSSPDRV